MSKSYSFSLGGFYCFLQIGLMVSSKGFTDETFGLTRGKFGDRFVNRFCTNDSCLASCERYNAACGPSDCKYCVCHKDSNSMTYFPSNGSAYGQCMQDLAIARNSGCFNPYGGKVTYTLETNCRKLCAEKVIISTFNVSSNKKCILVWAKSAISVNNQHWTPAEELVNDFALSYNETADSEDLYVKLNQEAYKRWPGALLKLQVNCYNRSTQFADGEHFCILFKFTGKYRRYEDTPTQAEIQLNSTTNTTKEPKSRQKGMPRPGDQYLASTIALSGILFLVFLLLGIGIFLLLRSHDRGTSEENTMEPETVTTHPDSEGQ